MNNEVLGFETAKMEAATHPVPIPWFSRTGRTMLHDQSISSSSVMHMITKCNYRALS